MGYPWSDTDGHYRPGDDLTLFFDPVDPVNDANRFWPNGMSKSHRQQYIGWTGTRHSNALSTIQDLAYGRESCLECHSTDYWLALEEGETPPTLENASWSIECVRCHSPHGNTGNPAQLRLNRLDTCGQCHSTDAVVGESPHHPNVEMIDGTIPIAAIPDAPWMEGAVVCSDCHMTETAKSAVLGDIPSHTFEFAHPADTVADSSFPNGCTSKCHDGTNGELMDAATAVTHIDTWQADYATEYALAEAAVHDAEDAVEHALDRGFTQANVDAVQTEMDEADYALHFVDSDASDGAHNFGFQSDIMDYAITQANAVSSALAWGTVSGTIVDANGDPVSGAQIMVGDDNVVNTSATGAFSFEYKTGALTGIGVVVDDVEVTTFDATVTAGATDNVGQVSTPGEEPPPDEDNTMLILIVVLVIVIVVIAALAMMMRRKKPAADMPTLEEEQD
jgi:predicted CXXCH cytochrome family protein